MALLNTVSVRTGRGDDGSGVSVASLTLGDLSADSLEGLHALILVPEAVRAVLAEVDL